MNCTRRFFIAASLLPGGWARADTAHEAWLKAKLTHNLARFAQWPDSAFALPTDPLVICVTHRNATVAAAFAELQGQTVAGRPIKVLLGADAVGKPCQVLFVQEGGPRPALPAAPASSPTLTISDSDGFAAHGGMVELVNVNDNLRFDVNLKALRAAQIGLSSQVLKLARQVRE